jgi:mycofactocin precursor
MDVEEAAATAGDEEFGEELSDEELGELLVREITIDGMCGVY